MTAISIEKQTGSRKVWVVHTPGVTISVVTEVKTLLVFTKEKTIYTKPSTRTEEINIYA